VETGAMLPYWIARIFRIPMKSSRRQRRAARRAPQKRFRPWLEALEERILLSGGLPADILVGQTLSSYFIGGVQNNQETITYTVYNEQATAETGVLLTDTLQPGVTFQSASQLPDQSGQKLAWSLPTIQGFDRASVTLTVTLPAVIPSQLDTGAQAFATLDAGAVSNSTPAVVLQPGNVSDPSLLASTPDANTTDPYIQEEAAKLNYNPQQIFNFLESDVGYNSYLGSLRGARGTLWSSAGNALDVASLGVALMRASGIPAQYVSGTLSQSQAQQLILSMFPVSDQTVGYIPTGTQTADPANDPQLLAETESHYWFQFDAGPGMTDADPLMAAVTSGGQVGQVFTASTGTFSEVADGLRAKTEVSLTAEIYSQASAAFGAGDGLSDTVVLDQTFNDVDLVGRFVTVGNLISSSTIGSQFSSVINTYTPYLAIDDDNFDFTNATVLMGTNYQETITNFPLGSQILTGLFLDITTITPGQPQGASERTLFDRIGFAARQAGGAGNVTFSPNEGPAISPFDLTAVNVLVSDLAPVAIAHLKEAANKLSQNVQQLSSTIQGIDLSSPNEAPLLGQATTLLQNLFRAQLISEILTFDGFSDANTSQLVSTSSVVAYEDTPRIILAGYVFESQADGSSGAENWLDLRTDSLRVIAGAGQTANAAFNFNFARGVLESELETTIMNDPAAEQPSSSLLPAVSTSLIFEAAQAENIGIIVLSQANVSLLDSLNFPQEAKARITDALQSGKLVFVPSREVTINGTTTIGWYELNPVTGETIGVLEDGGHEGIAGFGARFAQVAIFFSKIKSEETAAAFGVAFAFGGTVFGLTYDATLDAIIAGGKFKTLKPAETAALAAATATTKALGLAAAGITTFLTLDPSLGSAVNQGVNFAILLWAAFLADQIRNDPPLTSGTLSLDAPSTVFPPNRSFEQAVDVSESPAAGNTKVMAAVASLELSGQLATAWTTDATSQFLTNSILSDSSTVKNEAGTVIGSGSLSVSSTALLSASLSGSVAYQVSGTGDLAFYGPADSSLGVSGNWDNYSATITGNVSITLTTNGLTLNGQTLPAGTYTITTNSATLTGSGNTTSPNFSGSASITATNGTINLGPGSGSVMVGGNPLDPTNGATLTGYTGSITVAAGGGNNLDNVTLNGNAANVLTVSATPATLTTDQNTPITFQANVNTSFADTYNLTAQAPPGWTVTIDSTGKVTATPAPGLQSGAYSIQIIAQSTTNPDLVAQTTVNVTITPTTPGINFNVNPDPLFTVPFDGAQVPTAFQAQIQNLGPAADTYNLTFSNLPSGFTILNSGTSVTVPAGQTGILGVYLQPNGSPLPPPGTIITFTVTATSASNPAITKVVNVQFTMPTIDAITLSSVPISAFNFTYVTATNVGNVTESFAESASGSPGVTQVGLITFDRTLAPGQSITDPVTINTSGSTPPNSDLQLTVTATYGPANAPLTQSLQIPVNVVVPGVDALATAADTAGQAGNANLANRLGDLNTALTNLVQTPTSAIYLSQAQADITSIISQLNSDPFQTTFIPAFTTAQSALASAVTATDVQAAVTALGNALTTFSQELIDEAAHGFTLGLTPNSVVALPGVPSVFDVNLTNTGSAATTYDLSVQYINNAGQPANVTAMFSQTSVTLNPGQTGQVMLSFTETGNALVAFPFTVTATPDLTPVLSLSTKGSLTLRPAFVSVTEVDPSPTFTNAGAPVQVSAKVLNAVNQVQQAQVSYTVTDSNGNVVFTSTPAALTLGLQAALATVNLGTLDTTGFANGSYTITVTVSDAMGNPFPGSTGTGTLLIGSPVTASLGVEQDLTQNVQGTTATASSTSFRTPSTVINGRLDLSWFAGSAANLGNPPFIEVDFPTAVTADRIELYGDREGSVPEAFLAGIVQMFDANGVQLYNSGVINLTGPFHDGVVTFPEIAGVRSVRFTSTSDQSAHPALTQIKVFGPARILPPGNSSNRQQFTTVTNTLTVNAQTPFTNPLTLQGQVQTTPVGTSLALFQDVTHNLAYVAGANGIDIVDVSNPASPVDDGVFAADLIVKGGATIARVDDIGGTNYLLVGTTITHFLGNSPQQFTTLLDYSLADPLHPALVNGPSGTQFNFIFLSDMLAEGNTLLATTAGQLNFLGGIFAQIGTVLSIDVSNPAAPTLVNTLAGFNSPPPGQSAPYIGTTNQGGGVIVNNHIAYIVGSTSTGSQTQTGEGRVLVVDFSDPTNLKVLDEVDVPGTVAIGAIAIQGNQALLVGSTGGLLDPVDPETGNSAATGTMTLSLLDVTNPQSPQLVGTTQATNGEFDSARDTTIGLGSALSLGNGLYAVSHLLVNNTPVLFLVDPSNPNDIVATATPVPALVNEMAVVGNLLYTTSADGLAIYQIGAIASTSYTASVEVPNNTGVTLLPGSFNIAPTQIITGTNFDTYVWTSALAFGEAQQTFTWQSTIAPPQPDFAVGLQPGEALDAILGGTVNFTSQSTPGTINLPPTVVSAPQILSLTPTSQTVAPGAPATYDVNLQNLDGQSLTFTLAVQGLPAGWVNLPATVTIPAYSSTDVPLTITSDEFALTKAYGFTVTAAVDYGINVAVDAVYTATVQGALTLAGQPVNPPDPDSHGVVVGLTPVSATAGQGTAAVYTVQVTNTGSADDTFTLSDAGLPAGVQAAFSQATVDVPPGVSNFRDVTLTLTPAPGTTAGSDPFTVTATSTDHASILGTAPGTLVVVSNGVSVTLTPSSGAPTNTFQATVTNTGTVSDTFDLSLASPAGLVASLGVSKVTLAAGASQMVAISTGAVNFAVPGTLALTVAAKSEGNAAVQASASADLTIPDSTGLTASFSPATQTLAAPGMATFLLNVNNTGNTEDSYTATITGSNGPVTATLMGLDGQPTQAIPVFRLPGLSTGAILLQANLAALGTGAVTVQVKSLDDHPLTSDNTATVSTQEVPVTPTVQFAAATQSVNESAGTFTVTVTLSAAASQAVTVPFTLGGSAVAGVDYSGVTASPLVIAAGATSATITGALPPDAGASPTLTFTLGTPTNATLGAVTTDALTIVEPAPSGGGAVVITDTTGGQGLTLMRTAGLGVGSVTYILGANPPVPLTNVTSFTYDGQGAGDFMTVLFANGEPLVSGGGVFFNAGSGAETLTIDAAGLALRTVRGSIAAGDPQTVNYTNVQTTNLDNAVAVGAIAGPDTADRAAAFSGLTAQERFVQTLYLVELGRAGSISELDGWAAVMNGPGGTQAGVAAAIQHSQEAADHLVKSWYVAYLGRQAGGGEEQGWATMLQQGQTEEQVLSGILASSEFYARAQTLIGSGTADERYVQALYLLLLNRTGEPAGVAGWLSDLPSIGQQGVALGFLTGVGRGQEFRIDQFEGYYNALLHRPDDPTGLNDWVFSNLDMAAVRVGFEATSEFFTNG
jgi:uncharacterized membrane protein